MIDWRDYMSTRQVAEAVGVSIARVSQMARARGIEAQKLGAYCFYRRADLVRFDRRRPGRPRKDGHA